MLPSLARLAPTGAPLPTGRIRLDFVFTRGNPGRVKLYTAGDGRSLLGLSLASMTDAERVAIYGWIQEAFAIPFMPSLDDEWYSTRAQFEAGVKKMQDDGAATVGPLPNGPRFTIIKNCHELHDDMNGTQTFELTLAFDPVVV